MSEHEKATPRPQAETVAEVLVRWLHEDAETKLRLWKQAVVLKDSYDASRALIEQMRDALREMFAEAVEYRSQADEEMHNQCDADICGGLTPIGMALPHVPECPFSKGRAALAAAEKFLKEGQ